MTVKLRQTKVAVVALILAAGFACSAAAGPLEDGVAAYERGDFTAAGLPTRVPQANLIPGSAGGSRTPGGGAASRSGSGPEAQGPTTPRSPRSPDAARSRLSGFQSGDRRARGQTPPEEGGSGS